jgi:hypothetical protein
MADIVPFKRKEEPDPHISGSAICIDCKHEWVAVVQKDSHVENDGWLECPSCSTHKGRLKHPFAFGDSEFVCNCGNKHFSICTIKDEVFIYCPNCGVEHDPYGLHS